MPNRPRCPYVTFVEPISRLPHYIRQNGLSLMEVSLCFPHLSIYFRSRGFEYAVSDCTGSAVNAEPILLREIVVVGEIWAELTTY